MKLCFLLIMIFCHIVDDFYLQGHLAQMKQRSWWRHVTKEMSNRSIYKYDYLVALLAHAFSWSFIMMSPVMVNMFITGAFDHYLGTYMAVFVINCIVHAIVDDFKANEHLINLVIDQTVHVIQVFMTWIILVVIL